MNLKREFVWAKHDVSVWLTKRLMTLWCLVPLRWRHTIVAWEIGSLTTEPRLSNTIVGEVTVQDIFDTMRDREFPGWEERYKEETPVAP